jgi:hypothetical protein
MADDVFALLPEMRRRSLSLRQRKYPGKDMDLR